MAPWVEFKPPSHIGGETIALHTSLVRAELAKLPAGALRPSVAELVAKIPELSEEEVKAALNAIDSGIDNFETVNENKRLVRAELAKLPARAPRPSVAELAAKIPELSEEEVKATLNVIGREERIRRTC